MSGQALDSGARIPSGPAAAAGYVGVFRYLYNLTAAEVAQHHAAGLWVSPIAEFDTTTWHPVAQAPELGAQHGAKSAQQARMLGVPAGTVIWVTADTWVGQGSYPIVARYTDTFRANLGEYRCGIYGGARLVRAMLDQGHATHGWVTGAGSWDDGLAPAQSGAVAHQLVRQALVGGVNCDVNDIFTPGDWAWYPTDVAPPTSAPEQTPAPAPAPQPIPAPVPQEDDDMKFRLVREDQHAPVFALRSDGTRTWVKNLGRYQSLMDGVGTYVAPPQPAIDAGKTEPAMTPDGQRVAGWDIWIVSIGDLDSDTPIVGDVPA